MKQIEIQGKFYTMDELCYLHQQYEILCTAEYLMESRDLSEQEALQKASEVRRLMDKYDFSEDEAIKEIFKEDTLSGTD